MAITGAALQAQLGTNGTSPRVSREFGVVSTFQEWLIFGGAAWPGKETVVRTTAANTAAQQATQVLTALALPNAHGL